METPQDSDEPRLNEARLNIQTQADEMRFSAAMGIMLQILERHAKRLAESEACENTKDTLADTAGDTDKPH